MKPILLFVLLITSITQATTLIPKVGILTGRHDYVRTSSYAEQVHYSSSHPNLGVLMELEYEIIPHFNTSLNYSFVMANDLVAVELLKPSLFYTKSFPLNDFFSIDPKLGATYSYKLTECLFDEDTDELIDQDEINTHDISYLIGASFYLKNFLVSFDYNTPIRFLFLYRDHDYMISTFSLSLGYRFKF